MIIACSKLYLSGIEIGCLEGLVPPVYPPNCTLVELKYGKYDVTTIYILSPNCTLVELKLVAATKVASPLRASKLYLSGIEITQKLK